MSIPILREYQPKPRTGNVVLLLNEVRHALERLVSTGTPTTVDLSGIPMTAEENAELETSLGTGEVEATLRASGLSDIHETAYSGVWRVTHRSDTGQVLGRYIEVTRIPEILMAQPGDVATGLDRLTELLILPSDQEVSP